MRGGERGDERVKKGVKRRRGRMNDAERMEKGDELQARNLRQLGNRELT